jgi:TRIC channel
MDKVLSSYYSLGTHAANIASSTSARDAHDLLHWFLLEMPVVPGLLLFHSFFASERIHALTGGRQFWFKSYVLTVFAAFGGGTLAALLCGSPTPLFTNASNFMFGYITVAWYLVDQSRLLREFLRTRPINAVLAFGATAAKARSIFSFVDNYVVDYPGTVAGAVVLGGLAGSGGQLFVSLEKKARGGFHTPSEFSQPGWGFKSAYIVAALYYAATDPDGVLASLPVPVKYSVSRDHARYVLSLLLCTHAFVETLIGRHVNPTYVFEKLLYAVSGVRAEPTTDFCAENSSLSALVPGASRNSETANPPRGATSSSVKNGSVGQQMRHRGSGKTK